MYYQQASKDTQIHMKKRNHVRNLESNYFIQLLASAIEKSFAQYCYRQRTITLQKAKQATYSHKKTQKQKTKIIQISDDQQDLPVTIIIDKQQTNKAQLQLKIGIQHNCLQSDCDSKKNVLKTQPTSPTVPELFLPIKNSEAVSNNDYMVDQADQDISFAQFDIECPVLTMKHSQILKKRQSLLLRQVTDWEKVPVKGRKQRRQIRMLLN